MEIFNASDSFTITATPGKAKRIERAIRSYLDYHGAEPVEEVPHGYRFRIGTFLISSRNKPLHRFQSGEITIKRADDDETEIAFHVRLSKLNIFGCVGSVIAGLLLAFAIFTKADGSVWWALVTLRRISSSGSSSLFSTNK